MKVKEILNQKTIDKLIKEDKAYIIPPSSTVVCVEYKTGEEFYIKTKKDTYKRIGEYDIVKVENEDNS